MLEIHGDEDRVTRLGGDKENEDGWERIGTWKPRYFFGQKNGLSKRKEVLSNIRTEMEHWFARPSGTLGISREVRFLVVNSGGHDWPGGRFNNEPNLLVRRIAFGLGDNQAFNSSELIWSFFHESLGWPRVEAKIRSHLLP